MEQRISLITLGVADLARSRRFYEEGLGWRPGYVSEEVVFFQLGGLVFALFPRVELAADMRRTDAGTSSSIALAHNVRTREAVDAVLAEAAAAGAAILKPAEDTAWGGYAGYFADPDGHAWEIAWNPHWPLEADGSVRLGA